MREIRGQASGRVSADPERCFALLLAVDRYPEIDPQTIPRVQVLERARDGSPLLARAVVAVAVGPVRRDYELLAKVSSKRNRMVRLTRVPDDRSDPERLSLTWEIVPGPRTRLTVRLRARLEIPRLVPVGGAGGTVARGLLQAASEALESGSDYAVARGRGSRAITSARSS